MKYYIDIITDIGEPITIQHHIDLLRYATTHDTIEISINSRGGYYSSILYLAASMRACEAKLVVLYYGEFHSLLPLLEEADIVVLMPDSTMYTDQNDKITIESLTSRFNAITHYEYLSLPKG